jgi:hypothetical protein
VRDSLLDRADSRDRLGDEAGRRTGRSAIQTPWALPCALAVVLSLVLACAEVPLTQAFAITGVVAVQTATGVVWWALVRRRQTVPITELVGMGLALGTLGALLADQLLRSTPLASWAWLAPTAAAVVVVAARRLKSHAGVTIDSRVRGEAVAVAVGLIIGLGVLVPFWAAHPLRWNGWWAYYLDIPFHEALANSLTRFGPGDSVFAAGHSIRYHWFANAWAGLVTDATDADRFVAVTRALPVVALMGTVCLAWSWARRLSAVVWVPAIAVVLVVGGTYVGALVGLGNHLLPISPTQAFATLWLLGISLLITEYVAGRAARGGALVLVGVLAVGCAGGKVSHAAVVGGGLALLTLGSRGWDVIRRRALEATAIVAVAIAVTFAIVIVGGDTQNAGGNTVSLGFDHTSASAVGLQPFSGVLGIVLGIVAITLAISARCAGLAWLVIDRRTRRRPDILYATGAAIVAIVGVAVLDVPGASQLYFALSASVVMSVVSACGMGQAFEAIQSWPARARRLWSRRGVLIAAAVAAGVVAGLGATAMFLDGRRLERWAAPFSVWLIAGGVAIALALLRGRGVARVRSAGALALVVLLTGSVAAEASGVVHQLQTLPGSTEPGAPLAWTSGHADAARWLTAASKSTDVVATNRLCTDARETPPACSSRWFLVSALTGRRMLLEGYDYGVGLGRLPAWARARVTLSTRFADRPNAEDARALWKLGVRWVWVDPFVTPTRSWEPYATVGFANDVAMVLRLKRPADAAAR